ncbi:hypothetical protein LTR53_005199 [Teratosphaeriaceae sp. CCFEE 6253]|nr:hypothetical protein LTR53_005199 [Teratosphaeriaceae sp. CCFEE 6253]
MANRLQDTIVTVVSYPLAPHSPAPVAIPQLMTWSKPDIRTVAKHDPILRIPFINGTAKKWRGEWDATDLRISPLYADFTPLARQGIKVHGVVGGYNILGPDANLFREKCNAAGVHGEWLEWDKQMHVFPLT